MKKEKELAILKILKEDRLIDVICQYNLETNWREEGVEIIVLANFDRRQASTFI